MFRDRYLALAIAVLTGMGCARVMNEGSSTGFSADAQRYAAENIEKGLSPFREVVGGVTVSLRTEEIPGTAGREPLIAFTRSCLMEMIISEGGTYVGVEGGEVQLEIHSVQAGLNATERNFAVPTGQNLRVPVFYSEGFAGSARIVVVARDRNRNLIQRNAASTANGGMEYFLFRFIGPISP